MRHLLNISTLLLFSFAAISADAQIKVSASQQLSVGLNGATPNGTSGSPIIAPNGGFLVFRSDANNLLLSDANGFKSDIFLRDQTTGALSLASVSSSQVQGDDDSTEPALTPVGPDKLYAVVFSSKSTNLSSIPNLSSVKNIFLRFPTLGLTIPVTFGVGVVPADDDSGNASATIVPAPNKAYVAFASNATNLVSNDSPGHRDVYLSTVKVPSSAAQTPGELVTTELVSKGAGGASSDGDSDDPAVSGDGRYVVFTSDATNLISGRTTSHRHIYLFDRKTKSVTLLSQTAAGVEADDDNRLPAISFSGRYVVFLTDSLNLIGDAQVGKTALVLLDRKLGTFQRVNSTIAGVAGNGSASDPSISPNGRLVSFSDTSTNLVSGDTNGNKDVFLKEISSGALVMNSFAPGSTSNGNSDTTCTTLSTYNSDSGFVSFRSFASNLTDGGTLGGGDVFLSAGSFISPTLTKQTRLEAPADITVKGKRVAITAQKFVLANSSDDSSLLVMPRAAAKVKFDIRVEGTGARKNDRIRKISSRNSVTVRNLKPGTYTSRYRAISVKNGRTTVASGFSPRQRFKVG